ncbi:MAG: FlaD/FlaE family flagellar protein [Bacilli bacterium]|jgi:hypothetical protein
MDSLKTLIDRKQYELVLTLTKDTADMDSISYRIVAFIGLGRLADALLLIEKHKGDFGSDIFNIMKIHLEILLTMRKYDKALEELHYYQNLPYISQEVEEYLRDAPNMIRQHERANRQNRRLNEEEIEDILHKDKDDISLLAALNDLRAYRIGDFYESIIDLIRRQEVNSHVRTYALLLLVADGFRGRIHFYKNEKEYDIIPADLEPPFIGPAYEALSKRLESAAKDPSVSGIAVSLLNDLIIVIYPDDLLKEKPELLCAALLLIAYEHLNSAIGVAEVASKFNVSQKDLNNLTSHLKKYLEANPPIKA